MTDSAPKSHGAWIIGILVVVLLVLHQDIWFWHDETRVLGFIPIGLFWHLCLSVAACLTWWLATMIAWPAEDADEVTSDQEVTS